MKTLNLLFATVCAVVILTGARAQESDKSANDGAWLKDPITGCGVWNSDPRGNETISWSGECQDGKASGYGVLVWLEDGKIVGRFTGTLADGKAEGRGKLEYEVVDGFADYNGDFRKSEMHGRGVLLFPDKSRAEGNFRHDKMTATSKPLLRKVGVMTEK